MKIKDHGSPRKMEAPAYIICGWRAKLIKSITILRKFISCYIIAKLIQLCGNSIKTITLLNLTETLQFGGISEIALCQKCTFYDT
jgi:hypothetical protein